MEGHLKEDGSALRRHDNYNLRLRREVAYIILPKPVDGRGQNYQIFCGGRSRGQRVVIYVTNAN